MKKPVSAAAVILSLACALPAQATNTRTWVSGTGVDQASCGPIASPCRTMQFAHDNTSPGGEIDIKDSAGYGSVIINRAITILANGTIGGLLAGTGVNAVTVVAGANDAVVLQGLTIEGSGLGQNGVVFNSGRSLTIINCTIQNFVGSGSTGNGVAVQSPGPAAALVTIADTSIIGNASAAIRLAPPGGTAASQSLVVSHVVAVRNATGISVDTSAATMSGYVGLDVSGFSAFHGANGILIPAGPANVMARLDAVTLQEQSGNGLSVGGTMTTVSIGRSVISDCFTGVQISSSASVASFGDNRINGNTSDFMGGTFTPVALK